MPRWQWQLCDFLRIGLLKHGVDARGCDSIIGFTVCQVDAAQPRVASRSTVARVSAVKPL